MLNEFGLRIWSNIKNPNLTAQRAYDWVDRVIIIDESRQREVICDQKFSEFDFTGWREWSKEEYNKVIQQAPK
jgi:hypothetical protein